MVNLQLDHEHHRQQQHNRLNQTEQPTFPLCLIAHDIAVPMNIGSLFRIADALGLEKIWLSGTSPQPPNSKIKKTSRSSEKYVAWQYVPEPLGLIAQLKDQGYSIVSLEISSASIELRQFAKQPPKKIALVLGSENAGVSQALLDASDATVHIAMRGHNSSMNVANACAIAAFELLRQF